MLLTIMEDPIFLTAFPGELSDAFRILLSLSIGDRGDVYGWVLF